jgi:L-fuculose-phosphate aldolase
MKSVDKNSMGEKTDLVSCVRDLYSLGLTTSVSGNHSVREKGWMWITPSGIPRYDMSSSDLVRLNIRTGKVIGKRKPSIEAGMHRDIYQSCPDVGAVIHTHSPFTIAISISSEFRHVIEEAKFIVGNPVVIPNQPAGSDALASAVAQAVSGGARAVVVKNHGVVAASYDIRSARAIIESLEEWSKILTLTRVFGGAKEFLS